MIRRIPLYWINNQPCGYGWHYVCFAHQHFCCMPRFRPTWPHVPRRNLPQNLYFRLGKNLYLRLVCTCRKLTIIHMGHVGTPA